MGYIVYQHRNPITNQVFYIGSGLKGRAYQFGKSQRSDGWNLYVDNFKLRDDKFLRNSKIIVEILSIHETKIEALENEISLIHANWGFCPLINQQISFGYRNIPDETVKSRCDKIAAIRAVSIVNLFNDTIKYPSIVEGARDLGIERGTLNKQVTKNTRLFKESNTIFYNDGWVWNDNGDSVRLKNGVFIYATDYAEFSAKLVRDLNTTKRLLD